jgi:hypothetical protein
MIPEKSALLTSNKIPPLLSWNSGKPKGGEGYALVFSAGRLVLGTASLGYQVERLHPVRCESYHFVLVIIGNEKCFSHVKLHIF